MAVSTAPDFTGKVVTVYLNVATVLYREQPGWTLESPRFEEQEGRLFLVGLAVCWDDAWGAWYRGATVHVSWESVTHYLVFETAEAHHRAVSQYRAHRPKRNWFGRRG
jgi:hypothetical protein